MKQSTKKFIGLFLCLTQIVLLISFSAQATHFSDVSSSNAFLDSINFATDNNYMVGATSTTFQPTSVTTRGALVYALYKMDGARSTAGMSMPFTDVSSSAYYYNAVKWGKYYGIVAGTSSTTFDPNTSVKRQDIAVFYYRYTNYLNNYRGTDYDTTTRASTSSFADYDSISSYAQEPARWAIGTKVMSFFTYSGFYPTSTMNRNGFADTIVNFGMFIEGVKLDRDAFSFKNDKENFTYKIAEDEEEEVINTYYMNNNFSNILAARLNNLYGYNSPELAAVLNIKNSPWGGSCFGMSAVVALDKLGKIDFNNNFSNQSASNKNTMYKVEIPKSNSAVESGINYYHVLQALDDVKGSYKLPEASQTSQLVNAVKNNGVVLLGFTFNTNLGPAGHAVLVDEVVQISSTGYRLYCYDSRFPGQHVQITISGANTSGCVMTYVQPVGGNADIIEYLYISDFDVFDDFDLDGYDNETSYLTASSLSASVSTDSETTSTSSDEINTRNGYTRISVDSSNDFTITNAAGETIIYEGNEFSGTMNIAAKSFVVGGLGPVEYVFYVNPSDSFTISASAQSEIKRFTLRTADSFFAASGTGIEQAVIDQNQTLTLSGDNMDYDSTVYVGSAQTNSLRMIGSGESNVTFEKDDDGVVINALQNPITVEAYQDFQNVQTSTFAAQMNKMYIEADQSNTDYSISAYLLNDNERINHLTPIK